MVTPWKSNALARRLAPACTAVLVAAAGLAASPAATAASAVSAARQPGTTCADRQVPVAQSAGRAADLEIWGELCYRGPRVPETVLLLVPGVTYNHLYWDVPGYSGRYSYVDQATAAGYATFDVDPLGTGSSSHPASTEVTVAALAYTMHEVVSALRGGALGGPAFRHVVYVGHSLGSETGWVEAGTYHDVDALVATGALHAFNQTTGAQYDADIVPASSDPAFAGLGLDSGYVTTRPGIRGEVFDNPDFVDPDIVAFDEAHKDVGTLSEAAGSMVLAAAAPSQAVSRGIDVPVLVAIGQDDRINCGGTDGADCSSARSATAYEAPYYCAAARLTVLVAPSAGHDIALAPNAPLTNLAIDTWLRLHVAP